MKDISFDQNCVKIFAKSSTPDGAFVTFWHLQVGEQSLVKTLYLSQALVPQKCVSHNVFVGTFCVQFFHRRHNTDHKVDFNFPANIWSVQLLNMNKFWSSRPKGDWLCWYEPNIIVLQKGRQMASVCGIGPNFGHICSPWLESSDCSTGLGQITSIQVPPIIGKFTQTLETVDRGAAAAASFGFGFRFTSLSLLLPLLHFHFCQSDLTFIIHTSYYWQFTQTWKQLTGSVIWLQVSSTGWEEIHFTI